MVKIDQQFMTNPLNHFAHVGKHVLVAKIKVMFFDSKNTAKIQAKYRTRKTWKITLSIYSWIAYQLDSGTTL